MQTINSAVRHHEISAVPWRYRPLAAILYKAFDKFNHACFADQLPVCILKFDEFNIKSFAATRRGYNSIGAEHEITFNVRHFDCTLRDVVGIFCHELVHVWQECADEGGDRNYHNKQFFERLGILGLGGGQRYRCEVNEYGPAFYAIARKLGCDLTGPAMPGLEPPSKRSLAKLSKWWCGCTNL